LGRFGIRFRELLAIRLVFGDFLLFEVLNAFLAVVEEVGVMRVDAVEHEKEVGFGDLELPELLLQILEECEV